MDWIFRGLSGSILTGLDYHDGCHGEGPRARVGGRRGGQQVGGQRDGRQEQASALGSPGCTLGEEASRELVCNYS